MGTSTCSFPASLFYRTSEISIYSLVRLESEGCLLLLQLRQNAKQQDEDACKAAAEKVQDALQRSMDAKKQWRHDLLLLPGNMNFTQ